jgi:hypothetical protein
MIKTHWATLRPRVRELWPKLSEEDVAGINGNAEMLFSKVTANYGIGRDEILDELMRFVPATAEKA